MEVSTYGVHNIRTYGRVVCSVAYQQRQGGKEQLQLVTCLQFWRARLCLAGLRQTFIDDRQDGSFGMVTN